MCQLCCQNLPRHIRDSLKDSLTILIQSEDCSDLTTLACHQRARALSLISLIEMWELMKLCSEAKDVMGRFDMLFLNEIRECIFQKSISEIDVSGQKLGPFKEGDRANLPNWVIERLLNHEVVDIAPEDAYDSVRRLQNLYREEEKQPHKLQTFQPFLYRAFSRKLLRLQSDRTSIGPRKYEEIEKLQRMVPFLVETRLSKILRVAKSGAYQEKRKQMAYEERWLCEELIDLLSGWRQKIME